ncbi:MAG: hypothetical protein R3F61_24000 [Myxococcota bacterium]
MVKRLVAIPDWHDALVGRASLDRHARVYADAARSSDLLDQLLAAGGLVETTTELRQNSLAKYASDVGSALEALASSPVGYVRRLGLEAAERLVAKLAPDGLHEEVERFRPLLAAAGLVPG